MQLIPYVKKHAATGISISDTHEPKLLLQMEFMCLEDYVGYFLGGPVMLCTPIISSFLIRESLFSLLHSIFSPSSKILERRIQALLQQHSSLNKINVTWQQIHTDKPISCFSDYEGIPRFPVVCTPSDICTLQYWTHFILD